MRKPFAAYCDLTSESQNIFLAEACVEDDELEEWDLIKAFTQGDMDNTEVYVEQPHGFVMPEYAACLLTKPLEGTCQAGNLFMKSNANVSNPTSLMNHK